MSTLAWLVGCSHPTTVLLSAAAVAVVNSAAKLRENGMKKTGLFSTLHLKNESINYSLLYPTLTKVVLKQNCTIT